MRKRIIALLTILFLISTVACVPHGSDNPSYGDNSLKTENSEMQNEGDGSSESESSSSSSGREGLGENELPFVPKN